MTEQFSVLVYGYGNRGRGDDGAGIYLTDTLREKQYQDCFITQAFQLNVEDALLIAEYSLIIFVDAACNLSQPFRFSRLKAAPVIEFTTHAMHPSSVLALCNELYQKDPPCYMLEIAGHCWEMKEALSWETEEACKSALKHIDSYLLNPRLLVKSS